MKYQRAFTLIEMLVTVAIMGILATLAAPGFESFQRSNLLSSHTNNLVAALQTAKNEAIKRNEHTYLIPLGSGWSSGWHVYVDTDFDGAYTAGTDVTLIKQGALPNQLTVSKSGPDAFVSFNGSGFPQKASPLNTTFTFQHAGFTSGSDEAARNARRVVIAKTGRIRSCKPASASDTQCQVNASN